MGLEGHADLPSLILENAKSLPSRDNSPPNEGKRLFLTTRTIFGGSEGIRNGFGRVFSGGGSIRFHEYMAERRHNEWDLP